MTIIVYKNRFSIRSKRRALTVGYDMQRGAEAAFYTACLPSLELTAALFNPPCFDIVCQAGVFFCVGCRPFFTKRGAATFALVAVPSYAKRVCFFYVGCLFRFAVLAAPLAWLSRSFFAAHIARFLARVAVCICRAWRVLGVPFPPSFIPRTAHFFGADCFFLSAVREAFCAKRT